MAQRAGAAFVAGGGSGATFGLAPLGESPMASGGVWSSKTTTDDPPSDPSSSEKFVDSDISEITNYWPFDHETIQTFENVKKHRWVTNEQNVLNYYLSLSKIRQTQKWVGT